MREDEPVAPAVPAACPVEVGQAADGLRQFVDRSEAVFLDAGERLARLEKLAIELVQASAGAANLSAADGGDPSEKLAAELARLGEHLRGAREASAAGAEGLTRMRDRAEAIVLAQDDFDSTVRMLRMVGMNTRIETARAGVECAGMETVAADVRRLVDVVEAKYGAVVQEARGLRDVVAGAQVTADAFLLREGGAGSDILRDAQDALASLRALAAAGAKVAAEAAPHAKEVTRSVGEILVSLQAHDACRQIIEHVVEDLRSVESADPAAVGRDAALAAACRLSAAQLQGARERLRDALGTIGRNLRAIAGRVGDVARDAGGIAGDAAGAGSQSERVERAVGHAAQALRDYLAREREAGGAMSAAAARARSMAAHVREIEKIGIAVRIIALNARVETERIGDSGRALAVVAQWMQTCAGDVTRCTSGVSTSLQEIGEVSSRLGSAAEIDRRGEEGEAIAAALQQLATRVTRYHEHLQVSVAALHQGSRALRGEVDEVARRLADQLAQLGVLHRVEQELTAVAGTLPTGPEPSGAPETARASAEARYTMQAERDVHERVLGTEAPPAEEAPAAPKPAGDLGDNVELF